MEEKPAEQLNAIKPEIALKKQWYKNWKILLIFPLILVLFAVAYYLGTKNNSNIGAPTPITQTTVLPSPTTQATTPTISVKKYTNTKYGYTFDYPSDWEVLGTAIDANIGLAPKGIKDAAIGFDVSNMVFDDRGVIPFSEYAKVAAKNEIQNYNKLSTINTITTNSGLVGYETTWMVAPPPGASSGSSSESRPMTFFPMPEKYGTGLFSKRLKITAENDNPQYDSIYRSIILTLNFSK